MKIVIAPDSFKESLSAVEVANQISAGFRMVYPDAELVQLPIADGGEGTVDAMIAATSGSRVEIEVTGPLADPVAAFYGITGDGTTAVIEMAAASGLALVPEELRNPLLTTSYGTGELINHALDKGIRRFIIGIGGSATNDAGAGMLQALGVGLLDDSGRPIGFGGGELARIETIDISELDPRLRECDIQVACDVNNPLIGPEGASQTFAPQKGGDALMVSLLETNLAHFARRVADNLGQDIAALPGGGAAGGMGAALAAFGGGRLRPGIEIIIDAVDLKTALIDADLVITGEGRMDGQSIYGKAPVGVARVAAEHGIPVIALAGSLGQGAEKVLDCSIDAIFSISPGPGSLAKAFDEAAENLLFLARNIGAVIRIAGGKG
ncbi:glycerate kinase [Desulforhopalus singaporensis]|uniref:Glycerate kinase n=1 Tax=Desulforhopalus singaporensis TaxID=91360 RepID=A0A1H0LUB5_9BACT|nr:glycerate kinase [Desulforhopalus singaporensis]SDO71809.1 glycerate kinase [Desulforhopalus singaporensis]